IGFVFDPLEAAWDQSFEELRLVAAGNGGVANVSQMDPEQPELGTWCIGFVFGPLEAAWDQSFEELRLVAAGIGGVADVSQTDPERPELGTWCVKQARAMNLPRTTVD
ncbi:hypothetical protein T484DRAFT_1786831, partial [Baffinella frigidus]